MAIQSIIPNVGKGLEEKILVETAGVRHPLPDGEFTYSYPDGLGYVVFTNFRPENADGLLREVPLNAKYFQLTSGNSIEFLREKEWKIETSGQRMETPNRANYYEIIYKDNGHGYKIVDRVRFHECKSEKENDNLKPIPPFGDHFQFPFFTNDKPGEMHFYTRRGDIVSGSKGQYNYSVLDFSIGKIINYDLGDYATGIYVPYLRKLKRNLKH